MDTNLTLADAAKMVIAEAKDQLVLNEKQLAVIEAAKAWHGVGGIRLDVLDENSDRYYAALTKLSEAVRALLALEGGE